MLVSISTNQYLVCGTSIFCEFYININHNQTVSVEFIYTALLTIALDL